MAMAAPKIDRQTTTPFLLKLFYRSGSFHKLDEFTPTPPLPPHLQIYTWPSCTLRELTQLLTSALPSLLPSPAIGTRIAFRLVYPDTRTPASQQGRYLSKDLGSVVVGAGADGSGDVDMDGTGTGAGGAASGVGTEVVAALEGDAEKSLQDVRFVIGDYVSCAVLPPLANGSVAPPPASVGAPSRGGYGGGGGLEPPRGGYGGPRENGYGDSYGPPRGRGGFGGGFGRGEAGGVPPGDWRRGERVPEERGGGGGGFGGREGGYGRGRGRGGRW